MPITEYLLQVGGLPVGIGIIDGAARFQADCQRHAEVFRQISGYPVIVRIAGGPTQKFFSKGFSYDTALMFARQFTTDFFKGLVVQRDLSFA
jgi:hypothetical protein